MYITFETLIAFSTFVVALVGLTVKVIFWIIDRMNDKNNKKR